MAKNAPNLLLPGLGLLLILGLCSSQTTVFQYCDNSYNIGLGTTYLESPYYPNYYPQGSACRYAFKAPLDTSIQVSCTVETDRGTSQCSTENVYVSVEGDPLLRGSENFCGIGSFTRTSLFNNLVLAYISQGSWGRFKCTLTVTAQPCDCGWTTNTRIVNGQQANINEFPYMVAIKDKTMTNVNSYCGGTIISHNYIMTAAHCAVLQSNPANLVALCGDHDLSSSSETLYAVSYNIQQVIIHPNYVSSPQVQNDIALLRTAKPIEWSRGVGPICLPPVNTSPQTFDYQYVWLAGWGTTSFGGTVSSYLRKAQVYTTTNSFCQSQYSPDVTVYNSQICTASQDNKDACQYDSGGPVIWRSSSNPPRAFQLGIISFGKPCGTGSPTVGINTRVTSYNSWLSGIVGSGLCQKSI